LSNSNSKLISNDSSNAKNKIEYTHEDLKQANELKEKFRERCINELVEGSSYEFNQLAQLKSKCENEFWFKNFLTHMCSKTDEISKKAVPGNNNKKLNKVQIDAHCNSSIEKIGFEDLKANRDLIQNFKLDFNSTNLKFTTIALKKLNFSKPTFNLFMKNLNNIKEYIKFYFDSIKSSIEIFKLLLNFNFIFVFINSYKYFKSYLTKMDFDNSCITQHFRLIDAKRFSMGKRTLLPFKKSEIIKLNYPLQFFVAAYQTAFVKLNIFIHIFLFVLLTVSLLVDFILADFLLIMRSKTGIKYTLKVESEMHYSVCGNGLMAKMLSKMSNDKSANKIIEFDNLKCLVQVKLTSAEELKKTLMAFFLLSIYILFELYAKRLNKLICTLYFQKWEKKRIIWLYNDLLRKRKSFIQSCKIKINFKKKTNRLVTDNKQNFNFFNKLFPTKYKCCILCDTNRKEDYVKCSKCLDIIYCVDCWIDLEEKCVACVPDYFLFNDFYDQDEEDEEKEEEK